MAGKVNLVQGDPGRREVHSVTIPAKALRLDIFPKDSLTDSETGLWVVVWINHFVQVCSLQVSLSTWWAPAPNLDRGPSLTNDLEDSRPWIAAGQTMDRSHDVLLTTHSSLKLMEIKPCIYHTALLLIILVILLFGPMIINLLTEFISSRIEAIKVQMILLNHCWPLGPQAPDIYHRPMEGHLPPHPLTDS